MYMPRLRARQHEIFAVQKCAGVLSNSRIVTPIFEPVTVLDDKFANRLLGIASSGVSCDLVLNPSVGEYSARNRWSEIAEFYLAKNLLGPHNLAILSNADADHEAMARWVASARQGGVHFELDIVHELDMPVNLTGSMYRSVRLNVAEDRTVPSTYGLPMGGLPVVWSGDYFPGLPRNRDYLARGESIFSPRPFAYRSAGYAGISDFLTIGRAFSTGGGPAYAVVIHITYIENNAVRIRHFCSTSNDTTDDPGSKFLEALDKTVDFISTKQLPLNLGLSELVDLHQRRHFPGLGKVKELAMMNHILVMEDAVS